MGMEFDVYVCFVDYLDIIGNCLMVNDVGVECENMIL